MSAWEQENLAERWGQCGTLYTMRHSLCESEGVFTVFVLVEETPDTAIFCFVGSPALKFAMALTVL